MKHSAFEEAAIEASIGLREVDAEIERLTAKKELLGTLVRQLSAILPMCADDSPADPATKPDTADASAAAQPAVAEALPETKPLSLRNDAWPTHPPAATSPAATAAVAPSPEQPSFANSLSEARPYSLRSDGWPNSSQTEQRGIRELL